MPNKPKDKVADYVLRVAVIMVVIAVIGAIRTLSSY